MASRSKRIAKLEKELKELRKAQAQDKCRGDGIADVMPPISYDCDLDGDFDVDCCVVSGGRRRK